MLYFLSFEVLMIQAEDHNIEKKKLKRHRDFMVNVISDVPNGISVLLGIIQRHYLPLCGLQWPRDVINAISNDHRKLINFRNGFNCWHRIERANSHWCLQSPPSSVSQFD